MSTFKDTLNILKTDFDMKSDLPNKEPKIQEKWLNDRIYQKILNKNINKEQKVLLDGPPYANGSIHVGHSLNKILKDTIVRRWMLLGYYSEYIPGWDTHGMPIEHALIKKGINTDPNLTVSQKRQACRQFAMEQVQIQKGQFMRLGLVSDFKKTYRTLDNSFEKKQLDIFALAIEKGLLYQDLKPVYWSWSSQTALAEAEVEYADVQSHSIYVTFTVENGNNKIFAGEKLMVWTTTPWTLPSNQAIAVNPDFSYIKVEVNGEIYICAKSLVESLKNTLGWDSYKIIDEFKGQEIENVTYKHMLYGMINPIILADYVSDTGGTGLVHNASGFGNDDYLACKKYGIKPFVPIDAYGKFTNESPDADLVGVFYEKSNDIIVDKLTKANALLKHSIFTHSVAHDWRTKKPVMYRATKQWFVNIDKLKDGMVSALNDVRFPNLLNKTQLVDTIKNRVEWCISRQRYWGVPIPIIYDENNEPILDSNVIKYTIDVLEREGTDVWFDKPAAYFLPEGYASGEFRKETDIMDVWFDSGTAFSILLDNNLQYPCELFIEGKDQFRGWFNSSLINSYIYSNQAPYKQLLGCGFVLDEKGNKMSKSLGNVIDPTVVCNQYGADVLRLWVASSKWNDDLRIGENILKQTAETYRRIRNTLFKFILSNISDFNYETDQTNEFSEVDVFILSQVSQNVEKINKSFNDYDFLEVVEIVNKHVVDLSGWYFDIIKDALYCDEPNSQRRRAIQTVLFQILTQYLFILAPILVHTCEEVYSHLNIPNKQESIFLHDHAFQLVLNNSNVNNAKWEQFFKIKDIAYSKLEELRKNKIIAKNTEAMMIIHFNNVFNFSEKELAYLLNIAKVEIKQKDTLEFDIFVDKTNYERCERCWNYFATGTLDEEHLCERCNKVIKK